MGRTADRRAVRPGHRLAVLFVAAVLLTGAAQGGGPPVPCQDCGPPGAPVDAGANVRRDVGPVTFQVALDPLVVLASVSVQLGDATMNGITLGYRTPTATFDVAAGPCRATGTLMLRINDAPSVSTLYLDAVVTAPATVQSCRAGAPDGPPAAAGTAFRGDLLQWRTPTKMILARVNRNVSEDVLLQVDVIGNPGPQVQIVRVRFLYSGQPMGAADWLLHPGEPVRLSADITAGSATLKAGGTLTLELPSGVADGNVTAANLILESAGTTIDLSGVIATWPPPPAGPPPGSSPAPPQPRPQGAVPPARPS